MPEQALNLVDKDLAVAVIAALLGLFGAIFGAIIGIYGQVALKRQEAREASRKDQADQNRKYYHPLLRYGYELDRRLGRILERLDADWLSSTHLTLIKEKGGYAANQEQTGYFIVSTVYMIAQFFGWIEAIKKGVDSITPMAAKDRNPGLLKRGKRMLWKVLGFAKRTDVYVLDPEISMVSKLFQYEELFNEYKATRSTQTKWRDACKMHKQIQYSIGELMLEEDEKGNLRCKSFREFLEAYVKDENYRYWFSPVEELVVDLSNFPKEGSIEDKALAKHDIRPLRLLAIRYWIRVLMKEVATDLGIATITPEDVLVNTTTELRKAIQTIRIDKIESHMLGMSVATKELAT